MELTNTDDARQRAGILNNGLDRIAERAADQLELRHIPSAADLAGMAHNSYELAKVEAGCRPQRGHTAGSPT